MWGVRIVTNPGSNLEVRWTDELNVELAPQKIVVDGVPHDTRNVLELSTVDRWVKNAARHPFVQGTSEAEFIELFTRLCRADPEVLVVMTSRHLIGSHDAAVAAAAKLSSDQALAAKIEIIDTTVTDLGAGLVTLAAAQWREAGLPLAEVATCCRAMVKEGRNVVTVATLENLIRGGRASFLQGWLANFLNVRPILGFEGGKAVSIGRMRASSDVPRVVLDRLHAWIEPGRRVWVGIAHGGVEALAERTLAAIGASYEVAFSTVRPLSASIYLHGGPGSQAIFVYPVDRLPRPLAKPAQR